MVVASRNRRLNAGKGAFMIVSRLVVPRSGRRLATKGVWTARNRAEEYNAVYM